MNALSVKVAALMHRPVILELPSAQHIRFVRIVAETDVFAELPDWTKAIIRAAESQVEDMDFAEPAEFGGPGSGNHGHRGRPGMVGGSALGAFVAVDELAAYGIGSSAAFDYAAGGAWPQDGRKNGDDDPDYLYHATTAKHLPAITSQGLLPRQDVLTDTTFAGFGKAAWVYFAPNLTNARYFGGLALALAAEKQDQVARPVLLRIKREAVPDAHHPTYRGMRAVDEEISEVGAKPTDLEIWKPSGWQPIEREAEFGGPGSGNRGHKGRPGMVGGSAPSGALSEIVNGPVKNVIRLKGGVTRPLLLEYEDGSRVVWKTEINDENDHRGWHEVAAYELSETLGLHVVSETVWADYHGRPGTAQRYLEGLQTAESRRPMNEDIPRIMDMMVLDYIIDNTDVHVGNLAWHAGKMVSVDNGSAYFSSRSDRPFRAAYLTKNILDALDAPLSNPFGVKRIVDLSYIKPRLQAITRADVARCLGPKGAHQVDDTWENIVRLINAPRIEVHESNW